MTMFFSEAAMLAVGDPTGDTMSDYKNANTCR